MSKIVPIALVVVFLSGFGSGAYSQKDSTVRIVKVENYLDAKKSGEIGLGQFIQLKVENLGSLYCDSNKEIVYPTLYFNNTPMRGIKPDIVDTAKGLLVYELTRDSVSESSWKYFYHWPRKSFQKVTVSAGFENSSILPSVATNVKLRIYHAGLAISAGIFLVLLLAGFFILAWKTSILKDSNTPGIMSDAPFSMSKSQLAFWTFLIAFSFVYIWISTTQIPLITGSTWILLAISIGTTTGAKIIDLGHNNNQNLATTKWWIYDILNDGKGISIHRFQMLIWTIIIGAYFIQQVIVNLAIPQLPTELLALMGISNGTYLGLRIPEDGASAKDKQESAPANPDVPPVG